MEKERFDWGNLYYFSPIFSNAVNFPISMALAASHQFLILCIFISNSEHFLISLETFLHVHLRDVPPPVAREPGP